MKIVKLESFQRKLDSVLGEAPMVSESSTPIKLKYMGNDLELDGSDEWKVELERGDTYEIVPAKTARTTPTILFKSGREKVELKCSMGVLMQLLCGTQFPRGRSKENIMYVTEVWPRRTRLYTAKDCVLSNKWKVVGEVGLFTDAKGNLYIEFNMLTPLGKLMKPTPLQKLRSAFKQASAKSDDPVQKPAPRQVRKPVAPSTPVADDTVGANGTDIPAPVANTDRYIAAIESKMHQGSVWACVAPTAGAARTAGMVLASDARVKADRDNGGTFSVYKVSANSVLLRSVRTSGTMISSKLLQETAKFIRKVEIVEPVAESAAPEFVERPSREIDISHLNVSWSSYDPDKVNMVLVRLFNDGFFSRLKPRATTKGLVFDIHGTDQQQARKEVIGAARRVYQYLHGMLGLDVSPKVRWSSKAALLRFEFPEQSNEERESINLLMTKPPLLEAPIYTLDTQLHMTFAVESYNKNTGKVVMWPVRDGHRIGRNPTVVLYTRLRKFNSAE